MGIISGVVTFLCIWWTLLFCTLPLGVEANGPNETGNLAGAPKSPNLKYKMMLTTLLSAAVWVAIYVFIEMEIINFHDIAAKMAAADRE